MSDKNNELEELEEYSNNSFYYLPIDILAMIAEYLYDPRDLTSLYNSNKWLFHHLIPHCVKFIYINPETTTYIPKYILDRLYNVRSIRCDIRIETQEELQEMVTGYPLITEMCLHISTQLRQSLIQIAAYLMCNDLDKRYYRLEQYSSSLDTVWIGKGKIAQGTVEDPYSFLILYRSYITSILTEGSLFVDGEYVEIVSELPLLNNIYYTDCGYLPCTADQLHLMLNINDSVEKLVCVPCSYYYETDREIKFREIDTFISHLHNSNNNNNYLIDLVLPIYPDDCYGLKEIFPNLTSIGFRFVYSVQFMDKHYVNLTEIHTLSWLYKNLTIFVYLSFDTIKIKQLLNRNPEKEMVISEDICKIITKHYPECRIIDMGGNLPSLLLARDNWLFDTTY